MERHGPVDKLDMDLFNTATKVMLGNGKRASFWSSSWLGGHAPAALYPALYKHSKRKNRTVSDALTDNKWIRDVDYDMTERVIGEFMGLWEQLQGVALTEDQQDSISWLYTHDCQYTAQSAYRIQFIGCTASAAAEMIWKSKAPPKCKFFIWLMLQNRVWTAACLQNRG